MLKSLTKPVGRALRRLRGDAASPGRRLLGHAEAIFVDHSFFRLAYLNLHKVSDKAWRAAQPGPRRIARLKKLGIRTVVNLRGPRDCATYLFEKEACAKAGIALVDFRIHSREPPSPRTVRAAEALFRHIDYPVLFHCKSGADRAGLMSALYLLLHEGRPLAQARAQLAIRYGHFRHGKTGILDHFLDRLAQVEAQGGDVRRWLDTEYDAAALKREFRAGRLGSLLSDHLLRRE